MEKYGITMPGNPVFNGPVTFAIYNNSKSTAETCSDDIGADSKKRKYNTHHDKTRCCKIKKLQKGRVLLVNNELFDKASKRQGSNEDLKAMDSLWNEMGCEVFPEENLTAVELLEAVKEFSNTGGFDFYVVIIMSHGMKDDLVVGTEGGALEVKEIVKTIANSNKLEGKPKLIFFQMCRGPEVEIEIDAGGFATESSDWIKKLLEDLLHGGRTEESDETEIDATAEDHINGTSDVLLAFSTQPDYVSLRHRKDGSCFIQSIYNVFAKYAAIYNVATLMQMVKDELDNEVVPIMKIKGKEYRKVKETLDFDHTFVGRIPHLFPGFPKAYNEE